MHGQNHIKSASFLCECDYKNVESNTEVRSCNHCFSGKAMSITQPVRASVALIIQHALNDKHQHNALHTQQ